MRHDDLVAINNSKNTTVSEKVHVVFLLSVRCTGREVFVSVVERNITLLKQGLDRTSQHGFRIHNRIAEVIHALLVAFSLTALRWLFEWQATFELMVELTSFVS